MKNMKKKKGFTLVELLVVIAILAILATVTVIGYTQFIKKANMSADQQAVEQMNTMLEALDVTNEPDDIVSLWKYLNETGLNAEDYKPLTKDHYFFWDKTLNRILLIDKDNKVVYPEDYITATMSNGWYTLSGKVELKAAPTVSDGSVSIASASDLITSISENASSIRSINLSGNVNMMGASTYIAKPTSSLTISGTEGATLSNLVSTEYASVGTTGSAENQSYASGFIGTTSGTTGAPQVITIKNVVFDGLVVGDYTTGSTGIIMGILGTNDRLVLENVTIRNCTVYGQNKVGIICGQANGTIQMTNVKIENCTVNASESEAGKVFGTVGYSAKVTIDTASSVENTVVNNVEYGLHQIIDVNGSKYITKVNGKGENDMLVIGETKYQRLCRVATESTFGWFYPQDNTDVVISGTTYYARPATEITTLAGLNRK